MSTVTYEITAIVRSDLCESYERYMRERHIPDLLATGAFGGASLSRSAPGRFGAFTYLARRTVARSLTP